MSAAASGALATEYVRVPNSFIENQGLLTSAERAMLLVVLRWQNNNPKPVAVSDANWKKWTGLEPRTKEAAIQGLRKKCLIVTGRGDKARFTFAREQWGTFLQTVERDKYKARTAGRGVDPKPGAKIHPSCRERGCSMMRDNNSGLELVSSSVASPNAQRVAQIGSPSGPPCDVPNSPASPGAGSGLIPLPSTPLPQRVAHFVGDGAADLWARTLATLQQLFPLVDLVFLVRLVAVVRSLFSNVTDVELSEAVTVAWSLKAQTQKSEGLFLYTVPRALAAMRAGNRRVAALTPRNHRPRAPELPDGGGLLEGMRMLQDRVIEALRARGAAFAANLAELVTLRATLVDGVDLEPVMHSMIEIEDRIVETVCGNLTELERSRCAVVVEDAWKPYANKLWSRVQEQNFRTARMQAEALLMMGIPRLGTLYA